MNATLDISGGPPAAQLPDRTQLARIAAGAALSLAVHALLLAAYRQPAPLPPTARPEPLTVRLRPATPPAPVPVPVPQAEAPAPPVKPAPRRKAAKPARPVIAVDPEARQSDEETYPVAPAPAPAERDAPASTAPRFDLDAARRTARLLANEPDPAKKGTALERLPPKPLQTETKLERAIGAAKRPDCKDGVPGGLLAPLFLAMDKKDSGCKW